MDKSKLLIGIGAPTVDELVAVARAGARVGLSPEALSEIRSSRQMVEALADDPLPHYGVSTGFGALATRHIPPALRADLQRSLIRSHAASTGDEVEREVVRAMMFLRLSTLATGRTGVHEATATTYGELLNAGITPVVREYGSLGCSGDLAPLAHCALALIGEGEVRDPDGRLTQAATGSRRRWADPGRPGREGRAGVDQRHRRDAGDAGLSTPRSGGASEDR